MPLLPLHYGLKCWHCDASFDARYSLARYCSGRCANAAYVERRRERRERLRKKTCQGCGGEFTATRRDAKHCSPRCRQSAHRRRALRLSVVANLRQPAPVTSGQ